MIPQLKEECSAIPATEGEVDDTDSSSAWSLFLDAIIECTIVLTGK
jgi:hypothetical protein